jgi:exopolyphosphatase/guanosine-5'-triphosphate,3'-diphosphate pyrophosphatase
MHKYAAIDIGSNAVRMLFEQVYEKPNGPVFKKLSLIRLPIRLGEDAFMQQRISEEKEKQLMHMAQAFTHLVSVFKISEYRAAATSAMRESINGPDIIANIENDTGVKIEIIDGAEEARILYESVFNTGKITANESYMFIDVGGGSTEINFFINGERKAWNSFDLGSVRLFSGIQDPAARNNMEQFIEKHAKELNPRYAVGTGGNINKLYKLCGGKNWRMLRRKELKQKINFLKQYSTVEMVNNFDIKSDRADVIIPGGSIYVQAMKVAGIKKMIVPKVGLADGLIREIYYSKKK